MTVAALYVETGGVYFGLPDVDPWDEARDARLYAGPWPVVAHPPCARWSIMGSCRGYRDGQDGGCFEAALQAVRTFGGVLEHPALPKPPAYGWSLSLFDDGAVCLVDQRQYGHRSRKPTWLYCFGVPLPDLRWGRGPAGIPIHNSHHGDGTDRSGTPPAFRDVLLSMARSAILERCPTFRGCGPKSASDWRNGASILNAASKPA